MCCSPRGHKSQTWLSDWTELNWVLGLSWLGHFCAQWPIWQQMWHLSFLGYKVRVLLGALYGMPYLSMPRLLPSLLLLDLASASWSFFKINLFFIIVFIYFDCFTILVSVIHQYALTISVHMPPPTWISLLPPTFFHPSRLLQSPTLSSES